MLRGCVCFVVGLVFGYRVAASLGRTLGQKLPKSKLHGLPKPPFLVDSDYKALCTVEARKLEHDCPPTPKPREEGQPA